MNRLAVESTIIRSVGYDADSGILEIEFTNAEIYQYSAVPATVYSELLAAESPGSYFNEIIRRNLVYPCRRVDNERKDVENVL